MTSAPAGLEVLDQEPSRPTWRAWLVVGVLLLCVVGVGLDDRRVHAAEADRVERCVAVTAEARALADRRVSAMTSYVRPSFIGRQTDENRAGLARLVGGVARQSAPALDAARATCARVDVRPWHGDLRGRRDACIDTLDARLRWLAQVARDGGAAFRSAADVVPGCVGA